MRAITARWLDRLALRDEIRMLANDLLTGYRDDDEWGRRQPPV